MSERRRPVSTWVDERVRCDESWALGCAFAVGLLVVGALLVYLWTL
jgi:hypothetical protein